MAWSEKLPDGRTRVGWDIGKLRQTRVFDDEAEAEAFRASIDETGGADEPLDRDDRLSFSGSFEELLRAMHSTPPLHLRGKSKNGPDQLAADQGRTGLGEDEVTGC